MLTIINIYHVDVHRHVPRIEPALAQRLETLTGEDARCCVDDYKADVATIKARPGYRGVLARYKALADEKRLLTLAIIDKHGEMCACEIQAALGLNHATVSHHMGVLVDADLIQVQRKGRWAYYSLTPEAKEHLP